MKRKYRIVQTDNGSFPPALGRKEQKRFNCAIKLVAARTEKETLERCGSAHIVLATRGSFSGKVLRKMKDCLAIIRFGVGVEDIDLQAATESGIIVANAADFCVDEVSDTAAAFILASSRKLLFLHTTVTGGKWDRRLARPISRIKGRTLGLIGFGRIARELARKMKVFGLDIIAYDPYVKKEEFRRRMVKAVSFDSLLKNSDFISLHLPLNEKTFHLLGEAQFRKIKNGAYLINTSRGKIVDESALRGALKNGKISGAALDVLENEPPFANNPLLKMDNLILTPHIGSYSEESFRELRDKVKGAAIRVMQGRFPESIVNSEVKKNARILDPIAA